MGHTAVMDQADEIWNRAASGGTGALLPGDNALAAALRFHSAAMSGGVLNATENLDAAELDGAEAGFAWLGLDPVASVISGVRSEIAFGLLDDDRADEFEAAADEQYGELLSSDADLESAFRRRLAEQPGAFAGA